MIGASIFTLGGEFWSNLSYLFYKFISVSFHCIALPCVWWMVYGWMAWSGLLVLVVKCVNKFALPGGGFILFLFILFFTLVAGFGVHRILAISPSLLVVLLLPSESSSLHDEPWLRVT